MITLNFTIVNIEICSLLKDAVKGEVLLLKQKVKEQHSLLVSLPLVT